MLIIFDFDFVFEVYYAGMHKIKYLTCHFQIKKKIKNLEPAISTSHCSRLYGIFADENKCDVFWNCWNGEASRYQCSPGLAYDREARVCMWADQVAECKNEGEVLINRNSLSLN